MNKILITFLVMLGILLSACGASEEKMMDDKEVPNNDVAESADEVEETPEEAVIEDIDSDVVSEDEDVDIGELI